MITAFQRPASQARSSEIGRSASSVSGVIPVAFTLIDPDNTFMMASTVPGSRPDFLTNVMGNRLCIVEPLPSSKYGPPMSHCPRVRRRPRVCQPGSSDEVRLAATSGNGRLPNRLAILVHRVHTLVRQEEKVVNNTMRRWNCRSIKIRRTFGLPNAAIKAR